MEERVSEVYSKYRLDVFRLALSYLKNIEDSKDVVQDVFIKYMKNCRSVDPEREKAWLLKVTSNMCKNRLAAPWRKRNTDIESIRELNFTSEDREPDAEVFQAVMNLPVKYRVVVHLYYYEGYAYKEISSVLKTPLSTVSMRLTRARQMLKGLLDGENQNE